MPESGYILYFHKPVKGYPSRYFARKLEGFTSREGLDKYLQETLGPHHQFDEGDRIIDGEGKAYSLKLDDGKWTLAATDESWTDGSILKLAADDYGLVKRDPGELLTALEDAEEKERITVIATCLSNLPEAARIPNMLMGCFLILFPIALLIMLITGAVLAYDLITNP